MKAVKWGIISTADIALKHVVPAMMDSPMCDIVAIASRDGHRARMVADKLGIPKAYGSYAELFSDPDIEAVYNPLPNHLHVPVTIAALQAGKHVLCEKPIALNCEDLKSLLAAQEQSGKLVGEAFMVRHHPQWKHARELVKCGALGHIHAMQFAFGYFNDDPHNIRNQVGVGGGALYDIGVYPIVTARYLLDSEPRRVLSTMDVDARFGTDRVVSAILEFDACQVSFLCSTQIANYQRAQIFGADKRLEIEIPFNAPNDRPTRIFIDDGRALGDLSAHETVFETTDQYRLQGEDFSQCVRGLSHLEFSLADSLKNMAVIDALFRSATKGTWVSVEG